MSIIQSPLIRALGETAPRPLAALAVRPAAAQSTAGCRAAVAAGSAGLQDIGMALPPPRPPHAPVTARTAAAYAVLSGCIQSVLGTLQARLPAIPWHTWAPRVVPCEDPAAATAQGEAQAAAATKTLHQVAEQFDVLNGRDTFMAFMVLRLQGQTQGLHVAEQLGDMAARQRHASLNRQRAYHEAAQGHLERAIRLQHVEKIAMPGLAGLTGAINVAVALMCVSGGPALALTATGIALGFASGGVVGGRREDTPFDWLSAMQGASLGAAILPTFQLAAVLTACLVDGAAVTLSAGAVVERFRGGLATALAEASQLLQAGGAESAANVRSLQLVSATASAVTQYAAAVLNGTIAMRNFDAQMATALGTMCGQAARLAQTNWQNTTNFLSVMQSAHSDAVKQVTAMLSLQHGAALKAMRV